MRCAYERNLKTPDPHSGSSKCENSVLIAGGKHTFLCPCQRFACGSCAAVYPGAWNGRIPTAARSDRRLLGRK